MVSGRTLTQMRLELDARARRLLRRLPRTNLYSAAELALLALLAVQCARLFYAIVTPVNPLGDWRPAQPGVAGSPIGILRGFDPFFRSTPVAGPATVTSLQLTLYGTRIDEAAGGGSAILAGPDGVQTSVSVGQEIMPGVTLKSVAFDHVTITRGGGDEDLFLDQSGTVDPVAPPAPGGAPLLGAPAAGGVRLSQVQADIGFIARVDNGRVSGLVVRSQGSGAAFRAAGLRDGDVVTAIGGRAVSGRGDIERLAAQFGNGGTLSLTVERGSETLPLSLTIAGQ